MFFQEPYSIFTISAIILLAITILEGIAVATMGSSMDNMVGGGDADGIDLDVGLHDDLHMDVFSASQSYAGIESGINLLNLGKVPFMIVLAALTTWFTISGYTIHFTSSLLGMSFSNYFVAPISFGIAALGTYFTTKLISKILPTETSESIVEKELIGSIGVVVLGEGDMNRSVQVKVLDNFGTEHFIQARVALPNMKVSAKDEVIILKKTNDAFYKILPKVSDKVKAQKKQSIDEFIKDGLEVKSANA